MEPLEKRCEVVTTRSGARAMRDVATGELMHPVVGPLVEAEHLYVRPSRLEARLATEEKNALVLFDVGLGAGSNAIAAWKASERSQRASDRRLEIVSFENNLDALALALEDDNAQAFGFEGAARDAAKAILEKGSHDTLRTSWRLVKGDLPATIDQERAESADVVFWDPFSPRGNPTLWTTLAFTKLRARCRAGATVHTYSAATPTRSALFLAGFAVGAAIVDGIEKTTTIASVDPKDLERPLDREWLARLSRSTSPYPSDAPADALAKIAAAPQFGFKQPNDPKASSAPDQTEPSR